MPRPLDLSFERAYSPVPPPMPSPQLKPLPLPSPPAFSKRPSSVHSIRERRTSGPRPKLDMEALNSPVLSLKDAIVVESPRRLTAQGSQDKDYNAYATSRRPKTAGAEASSSTPPSFGSREYRRSGSFAQLSPNSQSFPRPRTHSPIRKPLDHQQHQEIPPPVPPLPPRFSDESMKRSQQKELPPTPAPIRIPELGLGVAEASRIPLSPVSSSRSRLKKRPEELPSFLHFAKRSKRASRPSPSENTTAQAEQPIRPTRSLPDIKEPKRRSSSFTARLLRLGFSQAH